MDIFKVIDGKGYKSYKLLEGRYFISKNTVVRVTKVQADPFAPPSIVEVRLPVPEPILQYEPIPFADLLHRKLFYTIPKYVRRLGEGRSGLILLPKPGSVVVPRSSVSIEDSSLNIRIWVGLPSRKRRILGDEAKYLLLERVPKLVNHALKEIDEKELEKWTSTWRKQEYIRKWLKENGYTFFIADGSVLPRKCSRCDEPLEGAIPFQSPSSLREEVVLPDGTSLQGLAGKKVNVVLGPAFHGKTTLLEAVYTGVWNRRPGDGREYVITIENSFYVESENGRWISCVDVSPFIVSLPGKKDTRCFSTADASGATSAAASVQEAVEIGIEHIFMDEDSTATNFLYRDELSELATGKRTVVPITEQVGSLPFGLTLVGGASRGAVEKADVVIAMDEYVPRDASFLKGKKEKEKVIEHYYKTPSRRILDHPVKVRKWKLKGDLLVVENRGVVDLSPHKQLTECSQTFTASLYGITVLKKGFNNIHREIMRISRALKEWKYPHVEVVPPNLSYVRPADIWFIVNRVPGTRFSRINK